MLAVAQKRIRSDARAPSYSGQDRCRWRRRDPIGAARRTQKRTQFRDIEGTTRAMDGAFIAASEFVHNGYVVGSAIGPSKFRNCGAGFGEAYGSCHDTSPLRL
jgi:hypothetical protein